MSQDNLKGQVAVVTGGGRGIGRVISEQLSGQGAMVAVLGRSLPSLQETVDGITRLGGKALAIKADVTAQEEIVNAVRHIEDELGPITLLVNNAGVGGAGGPLWMTDPEEWWHVMEVNLKGPFLCTHSVLGGMVERGNGRIINISSYVGISPNAMASSYSTSKAALLRLTDCVADGVAQAGVQCFAISPGFVWTDMTHDLDRMMREHDPDHQPMDEEWVFPAEDAANLCVRLASGQADKLTGRMIHVKDDLDAMIANADTIAKEDRYALRLTIDL